MTKLLILLTLPEKIRQQYRDGIRAAFPALDVQVADHHSRVAPFIAEAEILATFGPMMADAVPAGAPVSEAAIAEQTGHRFGSEQGLFMCVSGPVGTLPVFANRHLQNRVIEAGDQFTLLIENNGPGGFYTEIGRTCVLGKASQEMRDEFDFVIQAQQFTTSLLKPGAAPREVWEACNQYMREHGRPGEKRLHCHGQGYDMVERPLLRFDETMPLAANMVLSAHPTYVTERTYNWCCDNFLLGAGGVTERLHQFPQRIFELD